MVLRKRLPSALLALASVAGVTLICYRLHASATVVAILFFVVVLVTALRGKTTESMIASVAATLCLDYFFVPPLLSVSIGDPEGWVALLVFLSSALAAGHMSGKVRRNRDEIVASHVEAERLHALSRAMLLSGGSDQEVGRVIVNQCMELFGAREVALFDAQSAEIFRSQVPGSIAEGLLRSVAVKGSVKQLSDEVPLIVLPVALGNRIFGSLGISGVNLWQQTIQSLGSTVALGLAQAQAQEASTRAEAERRGEELKSVMIDALAHDVKTPLTAMEAAADMLGRPQAISDSQHRELITVIQEEAHGLRRLMDEAIHLARIDAKRLKLECEVTHVRRLVDRAVLPLCERVGPGRISIDIPAHVPAVDVDVELMAQALKQLIDNAIKYSPANKPIVVSADSEDGLVMLFVRDHGPGLNELEQSRIFNKFYRGEGHRAGVQGSGMGLAIAREIVQAHGGSVTVESKLGEGSLFTIQLRATSQAPPPQQQEPPTR